MDTLEFGTHTSQEYNLELEEIRNQLLNMGGLVEKQVRRGMQALLESDERLARKVIDKDLGVNSMEVRIDEECTRIIARRQPAASDLRLIIAIIKSITDLERIGDEAEKIAKIGLRLSQASFSSEFLPDLENLGNLVRSHLSKALNAHARLDAEEAFECVEYDHIIDVEFKKLNKALIDHMRANPNEVEHIIKLTWCIRSLERIGDHTKNICEYIIYLIKGKDIRHTNPDVIRENYFD